MRRPSRQVHSRYLILCAGHTEEIYAKELKELLPREAQRGIKILPPNKESDAKSLLEEARRRQRSAKTEGIPYARIWIICDHDDDPHVQRLFQEAELHGLSLAYSRPCLEYWFLLHFQMTGRSFSRCDEVIERLRHHWPAYQKTGIRHFSCLRSRLEDAIHNASQLRTASDQELPPWEQNPFTAMDLFVQWFLALGGGDDETVRL